MGREASTLVQTCKAYQTYSSRIGCPPVDLVSILRKWSFVQWVIDLAETLARLTCQQTYIIVHIYYFSKWVEAKALATIMKNLVMKFLKSRIVSRYGVPEFWSMATVCSLQGDS